MAKKQSKGVKTGRPWFDGRDHDVVLSKLRKAWDRGCSDAEASLQADISTASLSRFLAAHIEFRNERDLRKERPVMIARDIIFNELLKGNPDTAKWLLERKKKDEFSTKTESLNTNINANAENEDIVARLMKIPLKKKKHADSPKDSKRRKV